MSKKLMDLCHAAATCSDAERAELEAHVAANPEDVEARVKLNGAHYLKLAPANQQKRGDQLLWLATHRPEIQLGGFAYLDPKLAPAEHAMLTAAWKAHGDSTNTAILENAATFLAWSSPADAEPLLRRAVELEPGVATWRSAHARTLLDLERPLEAIAELEAALERTDEDWQKLGVCLQLLDAVIAAKQWQRAGELAQRILEDNETVRRTFQYGNAIHQANIALGWVAFAQGDLTAAAAYLVAAGQTPGSPQLISFGPDNRLAKALLAAGVRAEVRAYYEACRCFWEMGQQQLNEAIAEIDQLP